MRAKRILFLALLLLVGFGTAGLAPSFAQEQDEDVRGAFLTTRPKPVEKSSLSTNTSKPSRRRKTTQAKASGNASATIGTSNSSVAVAGNTELKTGGATAATPASKDAGLTLFRDAMASSVRIYRAFRAGIALAFCWKRYDGYPISSTPPTAPTSADLSNAVDEGGNYFAHVHSRFPARHEGVCVGLRSTVCGRERLFCITRSCPATTEDESSTIQAGRVGVHQD